MPLTREPQVGIEGLDTARVGAPLCSRDDTPGDLAWIIGVEGHLGQYHGHARILIAHLGRQPADQGAGLTVALEPHERVGLQNTILSRLRPLLRGEFFDAIQDHLVLAAHHQQAQNGGLPIHITRGERLDVTSQPFGIGQLSPVAQGFRHAAVHRGTVGGTALVPQNAGHHDDQQHDDDLLGMVHHAPPEGGMLAQNDLHIRVEFSGTVIDLALGVPHEFDLDIDQEDRSDHNHTRRVMQKRHARHVVEAGHQQDHGANPQDIECNRLQQGACYGEDLLMKGEALDQAQTDGEEEDGCGRPHPATPGRHFVDVDPGLEDESIGPDPHVEHV